MLFRLLNIRKVYKKQINVGQLHSVISQELVMLKSESDSEVKPGQIFKIVVRLLHIRKVDK